MLLILDYIGPNIVISFATVNSIAFEQVCNWRINFLCVIQVHRQFDRHHIVLFLLSIDVSHLS